MGAGLTDGGMDLLPEYVEGTGCNSHRNAARLPTFKNFSSKCLKQTPNVASEPSLLNLIHFLFNFGLLKENQLL